MEGTRLDLTDLETYKESCLKIAAERLKGYPSIEAIAADEDEINMYPHLDRLSEPGGIYIMEDEIDDSDREKAVSAVLDGRVFWEHTAAGEATRLKLGTKYLIAPHLDLPPERIAGMLTDHYGREVGEAEVLAGLKAAPDKLLPLNLGLRHMLQLAFDLVRLASEKGVDPQAVLEKQKLLLILNEKTADRIVQETFQANLLGFNAENFFFMVQPSFHGIDLKDGRFFFDPQSEKRLHNHGQLVMQETMDHQIFRLTPSGGRAYLSAVQFARVLEETDDKISYNIEDLGYLTDAIDWNSQALALKMGQKGYHMVMEIVANNPENPQKGGMAAFDEVLGRNVMIESYRLKGLPNEDIKYLNKNFNHYTHPLVSWQALKEKQLPMPITVKQDRLYFQPIQGDISNLVKVAMVRRKVIEPIRAWKSAANTIDAVNAMWTQDNQPGFKDFALQWIS